MESDIASTGQLYSLLAWIDKNRKQIISTAVILVLVGVVVAFVMWRNEQKQIQAGETLSGVMAASGATGPSAEALFKVASDYAGTDAGARALLGAAGELFAEGKITESQAAFEKFLGQYAGSPLLAQAKLGVAICLNTQGKTSEATVAFKEVVDRFPGENTVTPAKFYLAGLYEAEGKVEMARDLYLDLARDGRSTHGSEAIARLTEMFQKNPSLRPGAATPTPASAAPTAPVAPAPAP
jgi:predicted negative regulator of RcsB-dependent stress response